MARGVDFPVLVFSNAIHLDFLDFLDRGTMSKHAFLIPAQIIGAGHSHGFVNLYAQSLGAPRHVVRIRGGHRKANMVREVA